MTYQPQEFPRLAGMNGFSEVLIKNHLTLYQGYVTNTNKVLDALEALVREGQAASPQFAELKRRFGWEFNGMRLHELYFGNLGGQGDPADGGRLSEAIISSFGSLDAWEKEFRATGTMRGIGWAILYRDPSAGRLFNTWINEHDSGHPAGCQPLLVLDVFEHAFMIDYGLKRADYIDAFFRNIDWRAAAARL